MSARDPYDDLSAVVIRHGWALDELDKWRERQVDPALALLRRDVDGVINAEAVAEAVAAKVRDERRQLLSWPQKIAGALLALIVAVPSAQSAVHVIGALFHRGHP